MGRAGRKVEAEVSDMTDVIVQERAPNPLTTWAQFLHDIDAGKPDAGLQVVQRNRTTLMGGFARFRGTAAQNKACELYRATWERAQIGGARAIDPSVEPVDGGWLNPEATFDTGVDARMQYDRIAKAINRVDLARLHYVVVGEWGPTSYARWRYQQKNPDGRSVSRGQVEVRRIADDLARVLKLSH